MSSAAPERVIDPTARWKALAVFGVIALVAVAVILQQILGAGGPKTRQAPDIVLTDRHGGERKLSEYRGKVVLLNFWATWCGPCVMEIPSMERLAATLKAQDPEVVLLAASVDEGGWSTVDPFLRRHGVESMEVMLDAHEGAGRFGTDKLPETWVIARDGTILRRFIGPQEWDDPRVLAYVKSL